METGHEDYRYPRHQCHSALEAPLRHANGCHWGRFVRTIVEVETDNGIIGLGEMGGGGESAEALFRALKTMLLGHDPARLEEMRFLIANPTASLYNNRTQALAALEFACLDILGQAWGVPVSEILAATARSRGVRQLLLLALRKSGDGRGRSAHTRQMVAFATEMKRRFGFTSHKMKGGVFHPDYEIEVYRALAGAFPGDSLRFDPNGVLSTSRQYGSAEAFRASQRLSGRSGLRIERHAAHTRVCEDSAGYNTVVVNFETTGREYSGHGGGRYSARYHFLGRHTGMRESAGICETFQIGVAVHSSGELGIQLATMLHLGAVIPNLSFAADAHYHHLTDDIIEGGLMKYEGGSIAVPDGPGLGVKLDRDKLEKYSELYKRLGGYPYDRDPLRPDWSPLVPNDRWADPGDARMPAIPY